MIEGGGKAVRILSLEEQAQRDQSIKEYEARWKAKQREDERQRVVLNEQAKEMGLTQVPSNEMTQLWIDPQAESAPLPSHFYAVQYNKSGQLELQEYTIKFPVQNFEQFVKTLQAVDTLYAGLLKEPYDHHQFGIGGLKKYLDRVVGKEKQT